MKYVSVHKIAFLAVTILVTAVSLASIDINNFNASFHTFDEFLNPSFAPILSLPPPRTLTGSTSSRPLTTSAPNFQDCLNRICKGIPAFTPEFNECLRGCFAGHKSSTGSGVSLSSTGSLVITFPSSSPQEISSSQPTVSTTQEPYCIDVQGEKTSDRTRCAPPTVQGSVLFPSRHTPDKPVDDLIAEFLGVTPLPLSPPPPPLPPKEHDPLSILTALYTIFQRLPEFLKTITESQIITGAAMDIAYQGYRDARLELLNARTQCAEFYERVGKTPCTVALRSSIYALGKMRISLGYILAQDLQISLRVKTLFKDLIQQWDKGNTVQPQLQPSIERVPGQPFLE